MDYDIIRNKFKVIKRVEVPRGEYSYDNAINTIIELNEIYDPSWIYCDRGAGEYQIERLHIYGDEHPTSCLKTKVKGFQFKNSLDIMDPITKQLDRKPMKPFMVNQLQIAFERENIMLSPFDEIMHKQLIDYEVEKIGANGNPVFTSVNEHYIDALGLSYLAMVLEFPELTNTIKEPETATRIKFVGKTLGADRMNRMFNEMQQSFNSEVSHVLNHDDDLRGDRQSWVKVDSNYRSGASGGRGWGGRASHGRVGGRTSW